MDLGLAGVRVKRSQVNVKNVILIIIVLVIGNYFYYFVMDVLQFRPKHPKALALTVCILFGFLQ